MRTKSNYRPILRNCIILCMLILGTLQISVSCPVSPSTVEIVDGCPDSAEKWREAAKRKNCASYANQCDEPDRFVYHCVINEYANKTLEVCAYRKIIVLGHCTEYNLDVNRIQQNFRTNCSNFRQNPCPNWYHSQEAYKYQGCYELTKQIKKELTTDHAQVTLSNYGSVGTYSTNVSVKMNSTRSTATDIPNRGFLVVVVVLIIVILVAVMIAAGIIIRHRVKKKADEGKSSEIRSSLNDEKIYIEIAAKEKVDATLLNSDGIH